MRRRQFATLGMAVAALLVVLKTSRAQQSPKLPRIGWIWHGRSAGSPDEMTGFRQGLTELGYHDGQNVIIDYRFTEGQPDRIAGLAAELIQSRPDVLVVLGLLTMDAIKDATGNIPIVLLTGDPVGAGYVASLARPGGHITGVSLMQGAGGLTGKRIELLNDALPAATRIGLMFNPDYSIAAASVEQAQQVASRRGLMVAGWPNRCIASRNASTQKSASNVIDTRHARIRRLNQSITAIRYANPLAIGIYVMSAHQTWFGRSMVKFRNR